MDYLKQEIFCGFLLKYNFLRTVGFFNLPCFSSSKILTSLFIVYCFTMAVGEHSFNQYTTCVFKIFLMQIIVIIIFFRLMKLDLTSIVKVFHCPKSKTLYQQT